MKRKVTQYLTLFLTLHAAVPDAQSHPHGRYAPMHPVVTNPVFPKNVYRDQALRDLSLENAVLEKTSFYLFSHGRPGQLLLNGRWSEPEEIAIFVEQKASGHYFSHLNLYGCEFGKGEKGKQAVAYLRKRLNLTVSASDDITGKGGDWELEVGSQVHVKGLETYPGNLQCGGTIGGTGPNDDFDGDGICNSLDIDDDNDGVPDAVESPACFYSADEWNTGTKPAGGVTITSGLTTTTGNFSQLTDGGGGVTAVTFSSSPAQPIQNANVYLFTFDHAVRLNALYLKFNTGTQFGGTTKIQGSNTNNGTDWVDLSAAIAQTAGTNTTSNGSVSLTTSIKYPVTINTANSYKYIRITGVAASNIVAQNSSEVYFDFSASGYVSSYYPKSTCADVNIDGDGFLPQYDLDSDGDGCSDAFEGGATTNTSANYQFPDTDSNNDGLADMVDANNDGVPDYTSTYNLYARFYAFASCKDSDGDGILDIVDLDDDNDGITDKAECPGLSMNLAAGGGFSANASDISNWHMAFAAPGLPTSPGFTPTVTQIVKHSNISNFGGQPVYPGNSTITGGLFDLVDGVNTPTGIQYALQEWDPSLPVVCKLQIPLMAGANYSFAFDLGARVDKPSATKYVILLYNADTQMPERIIASDVLSTLPGPSSSPAYKTISGTFVPNSSANYYLLFYPSGSGGEESDFAIDRAAVIGESSTIICDLDGDGLPNHLDLDSDGDGCADAIEGGASFINGNLVASSMAGGNSGGSYHGPSSSPVTQNLGNTVSTAPSTLGIPTIAGTGQIVYVSQNSFLNKCADTDGDGINDFVDIDDDNDGILDAVEAPGCYYTLAEATKIVSVSSGLASYSTNVPANAIDNNASTYNAFNGALDWVDVELYRITPTIPIAIANMQLDVTIWALSSTASNTFKMQGSNDGVVWTDLSAPVASTGTTGTFTIANTQSTPSVYTYYRLIGVAGKSYYGGVTEIRLTPYNYIQSANPKATCSLDTDGDGIINTLDLDSDGDGCSDAMEGGVNTAADLVSANNLVHSGMNGGNTGTGYTGTAGPVDYNLGKTVDVNGVPTIVTGGQTLGSAQNAASQPANCIPSLPPVATNDVSSGNTPGGNATVNILTNDKRSDSTQATTSTTSVTLTTIGLPAGSSLAGNTVSVPGQGSWTYDPTTGNLTFDPQAGFSGDPTPLTYTLTETSTGLTGNATVSVRYLVTPPDLTPSQFFTSLQIKSGQSVDYVVGISNVGPTATSGPIEFFVTRFGAATGLSMTLKTAASVDIDGEIFNLENDAFTVTQETTRFRFVSKPGIVIPSLGVRFIGFAISRSGGTNGTLNNTVTITNATGGGETPTDNNAIANPLTKIP